MNPKFEKLVGIMSAYEKAEPGTPERNELGSRLDKEASGISEREYWSVVAEYLKRMDPGERIRVYGGTVRA